MRLGIYTLFLTPGQIGGIETYVRQLVHSLAQADRQNSYTVFVTDANRGLFANLPDNFRLAQISLLPPGPFVVARLLHKLGWLPAYAARQMQRRPLDVLHYPGSTIDQPSIQIPCVLTLHDIQHEYYPEFFDPATLRWRQTQYAASAQQARQVITVSEFTRQSIIQTYNVPPRKISAIYHGIDPIFEPASTSALNAMRRKYGLPEQFLFYPANAWPHKNHERLFQALVRLKQQYNFKCRLLLTGVWSGEDRLKQLIRHYELADQVQLTAYLPYNDLPALYAGATALVFPSLFEGFGLPALEAMACGCPVICSNASALPEVCGDAALYFDPLDIAQIADAIYTICHSQSLRQSLSDKGRVRAKLFSWEQAASQTLERYQRSI
ncbi:MAG: glycosyltransferase family 1 protein [Anaerolineae bacterium]